MEEGVVESDKRERCKGVRKERDEEGNKEGVDR